jgi:hypothetical protein
MDPAETLFEEEFRATMLKPDGQRIFDSEGFAARVGRRDALAACRRAFEMNACKGDENEFRTVFSRRCLERLDDPDTAVTARHVLESACSNQVTKVYAVRLLAKYDKASALEYFDKLYDKTNIDGIPNLYLVTFASQSYDAEIVPLFLKWLAEDKGSSIRNLIEFYLRVNREPTICRLYASDGVTEGQRSCEYVCANVSNVPKMTLPQCPQTLSRELMQAALKAADHSAFLWQQLFGPLPDNRSSLESPQIPQPRGR